jgi:hypothetical protein
MTAVSGTARLATMIIPDPRVAEVVRLLTDLPTGLDSFDTAEMMMELEDEFGIEAVRLAFRFIEASREAQGKRPPSDPGLDS